MRNIIAVILLTFIVSYYGYALTQYGLNGITTTGTNEDLVIDLNGTGKVDVQASIEATGDMTIQGDLDFSSVASVNYDADNSLIYEADILNSSPNTAHQWEVDGGTVAGRLDSTGLGLGITPTKKLYVKASANSDGIYLRNSADSNDIAILEQNSGGNGELRLYTGGGTQNAMITGGTGVDSWILGGDFGLGLTNPIYRLDVSDSGEIVGRFSGSNTSSAQVRIDSTGSGGDEWRLVSAATAHATFAAGSLAFQNSDTGSSVEITSDGKIDQDSIGVSGTWSAVLKEGSNTLDTATGIYTRVADVVYIQCNFENVTRTANGGALTVEGLPFDVEALASMSLKLERVAIGAGNIPIASILTNETISIRYTDGTTSSPSAVIDSNLSGGNNSDINLTGFYFTP